jgi:RNA-directed DNA polymerase
MQQANVTITASENQEVTWNAINWQQVNSQVNNLRRRIYRASCDGDMKLVSNLQKLMLRSRSNKLQAIRRVTQVNQGRKTPGVDKIVVNTDRDRSLLVKQLACNDLKSVKPVKRIYIPKSGGKIRPLGLPTILDRCRQSVVKAALEPYWEAKFEKCSYGFRPGRSTHDAIQKIFCIVRPNTSRKWVLDADIEGAFDNVDHNYLLEIIGNFPGRKWIEAWLKSGVLEKGRINSTTTGTPQGGIVSPLLLNIILHGMEELLEVSYRLSGAIKPSCEYQMVRYADDFLVFASSKELCLKAKEKLVDWLAIRGLKLSEHKTQIHHLNDGFDFLGFNVKHYKDNSKKTGKVLLTKPSKSSVKSFKRQMISEWKKMLGESTDRIIENLNPKIKGWCNYFKIGTSSATFSSLDNWMWKRQDRYAARRHPKKSKHWRKEKYWGKIRGRNDQWVFMDKSYHKELFLWKLSWTPIKRHVMVKGGNSPDNPKLREYWQNRQAKTLNIRLSSDQLCGENNKAIVLCAGIT